MYRYHALGGASLLVLGSALALVPSTAEAQTALPAVTVEAPRATAARPAARKPALRSSARTGARPPSANPAPSASLTAGITPSVARALLYQAPTGQTETTIDRSQFENRPAFSVADVLRESPGISVKQGNGPRDIGISIRGSNARNGFAIRNLVIFEDGFPVTQPDGLSRSDLIDPKAYGAIDVIRGPSSALYGNYATGGALNFRTRPGRTIDGVEYGVEGGSFGYLNNYLAAGKKVGNFEYSLFASDARGDGFIGNSWFNTQTVNFLGTLHATPDDRFTVKFINNNLDTKLPLRYTLDQFYLNPFQRGCTTGGNLAPGCATVPLFNNGFNGQTTPNTATEAGLGRTDRRTIVGGRWEHDFDNTTTWRNQFVFDDRNISQPTGGTSAIGDFPSYNYMSDITKRGEIFGLESTAYFGAFYNTLTASSDSRFVMPGGNATLGRLQSNTWSDTTNYGVRAREELKLTQSLTAVAGIGWETTTIKGLNSIYKDPVTGAPTFFTISADRQFQNTAPEVALLYRPNTEWLFRGRVATGYGTPQVGNLFVLANGQNGNNTQLQTQTNLGYDLGFDWTPNSALKFSATGFYEFFRNELVTQATQVANTSYTFNAPRSEHRGVELAADWKFYPGWRFTAAYTYLDQFYTEYTEDIRSQGAGGTVFSFNRAGNKIPGISPHELTARLGYEQMWGPLAGLGAFVEVQWKDSFYMDNANLRKAPGYELVNLNVHYNTDLQCDYFKSLMTLATATSTLALQPAHAATDAAAVVKQYAAVAHAKYSDALSTAEALDKAVDALIATPSEATLKAAREAWLAARNPYQETEVYRFGNPIVDEWEGKVNAWPLDEGLIDYVDPSYGTESDENALFTANVIANKTIKIDGKDVDATNITPEFLSGTLQEAGGIEANVATGYHAIEFLLWGQDLNGTGKGAGNRSYTDYDTKACTNGNCDRRAAYLKAASDLLVSDLKDMVANWAPEGAATKNVEGDAKAGVAAILTGMGSLSYGELAGERMKLGLLLHDPEEEHDCFSDNTYNSHLHDAIGIQSAYTGEYTKADGTKLTGPSLSELVAAKDPALDKEMKEKLAATLTAMEAMAKRGQTVEAYDQMIAEGNTEGNAVVQAAIDGLVAQAKTVERVIASLDLGTIELEGSDSLDNPNAVFQ